MLGRDRAVVADPGVTPLDEGVDLRRGLSSAEVARRRQAGLDNTVDEPSSRSVVGIVRANVLTRFNAIVTSLAVVVIIFGELIDAAFGLVMVLNAVIGVVQEVRAKRSLDALQVLLVPSIGVTRDAVPGRVAPDELVQGDLVTLAVGDQIPIDGEVIEAEGFEVDESLLTGESEPVVKVLGDEVRSGSFVVAGVGTVVATRVGADSWVQQLTKEAKAFTLTESELRVGVDRLLTLSAWMLPPLAALLFWSQIRASSGLAEGLVAAVAGVVALVPQGLVLLVSMALALAVIRLAKRQVVVQELPAVEGLARIDVLCVDKTGTLTTGNLALDRIEVVGGALAGGGEAGDGRLGDGGVGDGGSGAGAGDGGVEAALGALTRLKVTRSATIDALRASLPDRDPGWQVTRSVPFSSARKWSGAAFVGQGSWVVGAPEILLDAVDDPAAAPVASVVAGLASRGRRVLLLAHSSKPFGSSADADYRLPPALVPSAVISLKEEIRSDAAETMAYFARQGVEVKVVSGDNPQTVAAVAAEIGVGGADSQLDLRSIELGDLDDEAAATLAETTVFGRVRPEQKRELVQLLQKQGHTVAMTGDGVNDIPSLKAADIGIAMNTATAATKATAQLVLLDGQFGHLPGVVSEGRRVIANMERVSALFVTKTVYAALLALVVGVSGVSFPFLPRHLTVIATITIGIPAFALSFRSSDEPSRPGYLRRVLEFAIPAGLTAGGATLVTFGLARSSVFAATLDEARAVATVTLTLTALWVLYRLVRPLDRLEVALLAGLVAATAAMLVPSPVSELYALSAPPGRLLLMALVVVVGAVVGAQALSGAAARFRSGAEERR